MQTDVLNDQNVAVLGGGPVGILFAAILAEKVPITLWVPDKKDADELSRRRTLRFLKNERRLPDNVTVTADFAPFARAGWVFIVIVPSRMLEDILGNLMDRLDPEAGHIFGIITKGLVSRQTRRREHVYTFSQYIESLSNKRNCKNVAVCPINGPSLISELYAAHHSFLNIGTTNQPAGRILEGLLSTPFIHITLNDNPVGVELGGVMKNPIAIACGIADGLPQCGSNLQGELIKIGFNEILQFARAMGGHPRTLLGRSGLADLITTCTSPASRNRSYGQQFVLKLMNQGNRLSLRERLDLLLRPGSFVEREAMAGRDLVEGAYALGDLLEIAAEKKIQLPLFTTLYEILTRKQPPESLIALCTRTPLAQISRTAGVAGRQAGLSLAAGSNFNKILGSRVLHHIAGTPGMQARIKHQSAAILTSLEKRLAKARTARIRREVEALPQEINLWIRLQQSSSEKERTPLDDLIRFYIAEIADNYRPAIRGSLVRLLVPLRFLVGGLRYGRAVPHMGGALDEFGRVGEKYSVLYAPTHRSHLDSVEIAFGLTWKGFPVPRYAAGINLMSNRMLARVLKSMGAYAVDRERTRNFLYLECLTAYATMMLEAGIPSLVYPEGTRSRTGGILPIKTGLLATAVEAYRTTGSEVLIVPLAISYENVPEDFLFAGVRKKSTVSDFLKMRTRAYMDFGEPIPVSKHITADDPMRAIAMEIHDSWARHLRILPNQILARLLCENDFVLKDSGVFGKIDDFIRKNPGNYLTRDPARIVRRGLRVLKKRGFAWRPGRGEIRGHSPELLRYYGAMATPGEK